MLDRRGRIVAPRSRPLDGLALRHDLELAHGDFLSLADRDADGDGNAEFSEIFLEKLNQPFGMALKDDTFYVGNTDGVMAADVRPLSSPDTYPQTLFDVTTETIGVALDLERGAPGSGGLRTGNVSNHVQRPSRSGWHPRRQPTPGGLGTSGAFSSTVTS